MRPGLRRVLPTEKCAACGGTAHFMCGACKAEHYCNEDCRENIWLEHFKTCISKNYYGKFRSPKVRSESDIIQEMIPLQEIPHQEMIPLQWTAESYQQSSQLQFAIDFPLGMTWGIETKFGIIAPPTLPINSGFNQGMQFFPK